MPRVTYVEANGTEHAVDVEVGTSLMRGAVDNLVPGIEGDCGGLCACATCHIYVPPEWAKRCGTPDELETNILEFAFEVRPESRLACQIEMSEELNGIVVHMPLRQY
jgi:2Fe-2S ferredoxin